MRPAVVESGVRVAVDEPPRTGGSPDTLPPALDAGTRVGSGARRPPQEDRSTPSSVRLAAANGGSGQGMLLGSRLEAGRPERAMGEAMAMATTPDLASEARERVGARPGEAQPSAAGDAQDLWEPFALGAGRSRSRS